jgi:ATP-dependent protease ClpP protease subunit
MKPSTAVILAASLTLAGCASGPAAKSPPQEVTLKVEASNPAQLKVADGPQRVEQVPHAELSLSQFAGILGRRAYIKLIAGLGSYDAASLWNDFCVLEARGIKEVDLYVYSGGGSVFAGLALADEIERAQARGFKITAHARGIVASATVPIVAVCGRRIATQGTMFMVHEARIFKFFDTETVKDLRSQQEMMQLTRQRYLETLARRSKLTVAEWGAMEDRTTWFSAQQALEWGLVDELE